MLLNVLNILYLCAWATLLIHCLRNKRLYPIFGNGWGTKVFWLFTFVFFNPLLSLLYILCTFCPAIQKTLLAARSKKQPSRFARVKSVAIPAFVFAYTCVVLILFEVPRTGLEKQPLARLDKSKGVSTISKGALLRTGANIGFIKATNKIQTVGSDSATDGMYVSLGKIMIISKNSNQFVELVATKMLQSLAVQPYVDSVTYCSDGNQPEADGRQPDVSVTLDMPELVEDRFLLSRWMQVKIECNAASSISEDLSTPVDTSASRQVVPFKIKSQLQHTSRTLCIECPGTERELEAQNISRELTEAITRQFDNLLAKYKELPEQSYGRNVRP